MRLPNNSQLRRGHSHYHWLLLWGLLLSCGGPRFFLRQLFVAVPLLTVYYQHRDHRSGDGCRNQSCDRQD
jgi:hypothetical protein